MILGMWSKTYAEINSGVNDIDRLSENWFRENKIISKKNVFNKMIFQGPKDYIAQLCEVHLQYVNSTTKWRFESNPLTEGRGKIILDIGGGGRVQLPNIKKI